MEIRETYMQYRLIVEELNFAYKITLFFKSDSLARIVKSVMMEDELYENCTISILDQSNNEIG